MALFLRYQSTHERAFHTCLNDLLKLRAEKRKNEIGFESQKREQEEHTRMQEQHEMKKRSPEMGRSPLGSQALPPTNLTERLEVLPTAA